MTIVGFLREFNRSETKHKLTNTMKKINTTLLAVLMTASAASATVVVQENFTYADGDVDAYNGGTGWASAWENGNSNATRRFTVSSNEAIYNAGGNGTTTVQSRAFTSAYTIDVNTTLTLTFDSIVNEAQLGRGIGLNLTDSTSGESVFIGKQVNQGKAGGIHSSMGGGTDYAFTAAGSGSATLTAIFTSDGTDTFVSINDGAGAVTGTISGTQYSFDGLDLTGYHASTVSNGMDNISIDVTTVPEPSSAALLGLGGLALIFRRRK